VDATTSTSGSNETSGLVFRGIQVDAVWNSEWGGVDAARWMQSGEWMQHSSGCSVEWMQQSGCSLVDAGLKWMQRRVDAALVDAALSGCSSSGCSSNVSGYSSVHLSPFP